jgi:hypothetical protein
VNFVHAISSPDQTLISATDMALAHLHVLCYHSNSGSTYARFVQQVEDTMKHIKFDQDEIHRIVIWDQDEDKDYTEGLELKIGTISFNRESGTLHLYLDLDVKEIITH